MEQYVQAIAGAELFGEGTKDRVPPNPPLPTPTITGEVTLIGTVVAEDAAASVAVVEETSRGSQRIARVGDRVSGGMTIVAIDNACAVVSRGGERARLCMDLTTDVGRPPSHRAGGQERAVEPRAQHTPSPGAILRQDDGSYLIEESEIRKAIADWGNLLQQVRFAPLVRDGKTQGFRAFDLRQGSTLEAVGLRNGDVVSRVNGHELSSPTALMPLLQEIGAGSDLMVELVRQGEPVTLSYHIR